MNLWECEPKPAKAWSWVCGGKDVRVRQVGLVGLVRLVGVRQVCCAVTLY
ncbi:hypothetical protein [Capnocytophaga bilenii]